MRAFVIALLVSALAGGMAMVPSPSIAQQKTTKQCRAEWQANRADNQAKGTTEKAYVAQCRAGTTPAAPTTAPATTEAHPPAAAPPATPSTSRRTAAPVATAPTEQGQFATVAEAKGHCPGDTIVWVNLNSKVYHFAGTKDYGRTKHGAYMCQTDANAAGDRASKAEKHR
jgi:hypothetical protein